MDITISQAVPLLTEVLQAGLVPNILGSPGIGKSDIVKELARSFNLKLIDFRLAQADPTDMSGFPTINKETSRSYYAPPDSFPLEEDPIPKGYEGWLLFFDEMPSAPLSVQVAAYKIILDKMVGNHKLHKRVAIVCAGNKVTDKAFVNRLSTAMQSRLIHFTLEVSFKDFEDYAVKKEFDHRVLGFIQFRPELLHKFDPNHKDNTFPCPRTWEFLSRMIKNKPSLDDNIVPLITGTVGEGPGLEFFGFTKIYKELPSFDDIILNPKNAILPSEPDSRYAVSSLISSSLNTENIDALMNYIERLPIEFQIITLRNGSKRVTKINKIPSVKKWISINAAEFM